MNDNELDRALRLALEIEGLVLLKQTRDENAPDEIARLLTGKTRELAAIFEDTDLSAVVHGEAENGSTEDVVTDIVCDTPLPDVEQVLPVASQDDSSDVSDCAQPTTEPHRLEDRIAEKAARELKKALTLNDRYRFSRELFGNNNDSLNNALDTISDFASYCDAEQWIVATLGLDPDDDVVKEFMGIVAKHFN